MNTTTIFIAAGVLVVIALLAFLFKESYVIAEPNQAYIISSMKKDLRILVGKAGLKIPFFEKLSKLDLSIMQVHIKTNDGIPTKEFINIDVDAVATVKISSKDELLKSAAEALLDKRTEEIEGMIKQILLGSTREIIAEINIKDINDKSEISKKIMESVRPELEKIGVEATNFNIQNFNDKEGIIKNLGIDNAEQISKDAQIAKAHAQRDVAVAKAQAEKEANDAKVASELEIAQKNNELSIKLAELKVREDTKAAEAEAAKEIQAEIQRKTIEINKQDADIAKQTKEAELAERQIAVQERRLDAEIRKQADAEKYKAEKYAEAAAYKAKQEADAKKYAAQQEAEAIRIKGEAEAEAIQKKADAMKHYEDAAMAQMYLEVLPDIVKNAAEPLSKVDKITMYGEGNETKLVGGVMKTVNQIFEGLKDNGIDVKGFIDKIGTKKNKSVSMLKPENNNLNDVIDTLTGRNEE